LKIKAAIANGQYGTDTILIVQDFTQIKTQKGTFYQDLILTLYSYNIDTTSLQHSFKHYILKDKNNIFFAMSTWLKFLINLYDITQIIIYSDGCSRHFKNSTIVTFFAIIFKMLKIKIILHYFFSNHGNNAYDAVASHAKKKVK
jgi:hypothetical protein